MTTNSSVENLRPVWTASESDASALMWLRGRYTTFINFSMALVGIVRQAGGALVMPGTFRSPQDNGPRRASTRQLRQRRDGRLPDARANGGPEELRLFDTRRNISRVQLPAGYDDRQPVAGDFTCDGQTDIYWYAPGPTADRFWRQYSSAFMASTPQQVQGTYLPVVGDFDGASFALKMPQPVNGNYLPTVGNFDGTGGDDIFWYYRSGPDPLWLSMNSRYFINTRTCDMGPPPPGGHQAVSGTSTTPDDIIWYAPTAADTIWESRQSHSTWPAR